MAAALVRYDHSERGPQAIVLTQNPDGSWNVHRAAVEDAETNRPARVERPFDTADWTRAINGFTERVFDKGLPS